MKNNTLTPCDSLFRALLREHRARIRLCPFGGFLLTVTFSLAIQGLLLPRFFRENFTGLFRWQIATALFFLIAGFVIAAFLLFRNRRSPAVTAAELDAEAHAKNRLETAWELRDSDHILKRDLLEDACNAYREFRFSRRPLGVNLILAGIGLVLFGNIILLAATHGNATAGGKPPSAEQKTDSAHPGHPEKNKHAANAPKPDDTEHADLLLTLPESEQRAKPLDEIEWEGTGTSSNGFTKLVLTVSVNGKQKCELEPEIPAKQPGEIKIGGFLSLEELEVKPFDLVSIHLTGIARIGGKEVEILSTPLFIEVRPFREDTLVLNADALSGETFELLNLFLAIQMDLNKALFRTRILQRSSKGQVEQVREAIRALEREQQKLSSDLEEYLNSEEARKIPADSVNHLEKSLESMKQTCRELKRSL